MKTEYGEDSLKITQSVGLRFFISGKCLLGPVRAEVMEGCLRQNCFGFLCCCPKLACAGVIEGACGRTDPDFYAAVRNRSVSE